MKQLSLLGAMALILTLASCAPEPTKKNHQLLTAYKAAQAPTIDGTFTEPIWDRSAWLPLDQLWMGEAYTPRDFSGRYKVAWDEEALYLLVEIRDDSLHDAQPDPLKRYWDDDCVEIFVDEDNSGGEHQFNHNAFAYHVALDGHVVDLAHDQEPRLYDDHVKSARNFLANTKYWELSVKLYPDSYKDGARNKPRKLRLGEQIGFALAYCDNDGSEERENFIGSVEVPGEDKNQGWINADIFGTLELQN
ncbi:MAG: CBM9 family sugar-binding protein [Flavobacteriaceae bacterium]|nr:CBM9 family sugar-binding protein [Flavobacteriaceae bacterium]MDH3796250.1 CBM9 family sugar-binding protein [Flavobacteriaceae bacterium]